MRAAILYALCAALVIVYVNTFVVWQLLTLQFGAGVALVPWLMAALLALGFFFVWRRRGFATQAGWFLLSAALVIALAGLLIADPDFPAKRVHVPQYAVLGAIIWFALPAALDTPSRIAACVLTGTLFGIHDEFLQGLHPDRTFGLRDMIVNFCGVVAGAFAVAACRGPTAGSGDQPVVTRDVIAAGFMSATGLVLYLYAMAALAVRPLPYWPVLPMLAGAFALAITLNRKHVDPALREVAIVIVLLLVALAVYPVMANETSLHFA